MKKFKKTYIEITNICNLSCDFCPKSRRKPQFMSLDSFKKIASDIKEYSEYIYFHVKGEPLLHPDIEEFLNIADFYNYKVNITTNGTLIGETMDKLINKPAIRQINFSLHSFDANTKTETLEAYLHKILFFASEASAKTKIISALRLWNLNEKDNFSNDIERNRHVLNYIEKFFNLDYVIEETLDKGRGIKLNKNIYLNFASHFNWPDINSAETSSKGFCFGLRDQVAILVDGTVVPCCLDGEGIINLGNINALSFKDIIEAPKANAIYNGFSNREVIEPLCQKCDYRKRFD